MKLRLSAQTLQSETGRYSQEIKHREMNGFVHTTKGLACPVLKIKFTTFQHIPFTLKKENKCWNPFMKISRMLPL